MTGDRTHESFVAQFIFELSNGTLFKQAHMTFSAKKSEHLMINIQCTYIISYNSNTGSPLRETVEEVVYL